MTRHSQKELRKLKLLVSGVAVTALIVRIVFPELRIDAVSLGLLALALLPWLSPLIKSAELPGGVKIEFQDVKDAAEKVAGLVHPPPAPAPAAGEPTFIAIADQDPNLALVSLRIEIEKRLRALAEASGASTKRSLTQLTSDLQLLGVIEPQAASGLRDLISFGNQAAHGTPVSPEAARSAVEYAPLVLKALDAKLGGNRGAA